MKPVSIFWYLVVLEVWNKATFYDISQSKLDVFKQKDPWGYSEFWLDIWGAYIYKDKRNKRSGWFSSDKFPLPPRYAFEIFFDFGSYGKLIFMTIIGNYWQLLHGNYYPLLTLPLILAENMWYHIVKLSFNFGLNTLQSQS